MVPMSPPDLRCIPAGCLGQPWLTRSEVDDNCQNCQWIRTPAMSRIGEACNLFWMVNRLTADKDREQWEPLGASVY